MHRDARTIWLGQRLRQIREERLLSLEALAALTGVSKPMLSQVERGVSTPTVATLWKIADGLGVPFASFIADPPAAKLVRSQEQSVFYEDDQRFAAFSTYAGSSDRLELFRLELQPGCRRMAEPHARKVVEHITVSSGALVLEVREQRYEIREGDAIHFFADALHTYTNPYEVPCIANLAILYPPSIG